MIGQIVNFRYEVLEKIGDSELFSVYKARDKVLNRLVALKVLAKDLAADREFGTVVAAGYRDVAGLAHPNIARVLDADCTAESCFAACEYAHGINVKERVRRAGPMAVPLVLDVIIPVLEALEYAHANRVVHGDIRPQDIIVSPDGEVKLADFGLSSALRKCPSIADKYQMRSIHYQAPEIVEGALPTVSSDLYSIGVVLYEMLTNALPFDGATAVSIALKKVKETPAQPRSINTGVPKTLNDIIMSAIESSTKERYSSASAMLADLRGLRDALRIGHSSAANPAPAARPERVVEESYHEVGEDSLKKRYVWLLLLFVLVVLVTMGGAMFFQLQKGEIAVPSLLNKTWDEAQAEAAKVGLQLEEEPRVYSDTYESGKICSMLPPAGASVPRSNPVVKVRISNGPSQVEVPDLTGLNERGAADAAVHAGFTIDNIKSDYSEKVPADRVISQDPPAGVRRPPNSAIDLVVSSGPKPVVESPSDDSAPGTLRHFTVSVEVPEDADGSQDVIVKVIDDKGENTAYEQSHEPGDKFSIPVDTEGEKPRIKVFVGGVLKNDYTY